MIRSERRHGGRAEQRALATGDAIPIRSARFVEAADLVVGQS
jgi:hypothetical protein